MEHDLNTTDDLQLYEKHLGANEITVLRTALGCSIAALYSPEIKVSRYWSVTPVLSFHIGDGRFLVVESRWDETPVFGLDYHEMVVSIEDHPKGVPRVFDASGRKMMGSPASEVGVGGPRSPVASISVLEHEESHRSETVRYDAGLIFGLADGRRVAIVVHRSILGGLECATEPEAIDEVVAEYRERFVLE